MPANRTGEGLTARKLAVNALPRRSPEQIDRNHVEALNDLTTLRLLLRQRLAPDEPRWLLDAAAKARTPEEIVTLEARIMNALSSLPESRES